MNVHTVLALAALVVFLSYRLQFSRTGRAWLALREDELAAGPMGIDHIHYKLLAFAIGAGWSTAQTQPCGSFSIAKRPTPSTVIAGATTAPPIFCALAIVWSALVTAT